MSYCWQLACSVLSQEFLIFMWCDIVHCNFIDICFLDSNASFTLSNFTTDLVVAEEFPQLGDDHSVLLDLTQLNLILIIKHFKNNAVGQSARH